VIVSTYRIDRDEHTSNLQKLSDRHETELSKEIE